MRNPLKMIRYSPNPSKRTYFSGKKTQLSFFQEIKLSLDLFMRLIESNFCLIVMPVSCSSSWLTVNLDRNQDAILLLNH